MSTLARLIETIRPAIYSGSCRPGELPQLPDLVIHLVIADENRNKCIRTRGFRTPPDSPLAKTLGYELPLLGDSCRVSVRRAQTTAWLQQIDQEGGHPIRMIPRRTAGMCLTCGAPCRPIDPCRCGRSDSHTPLELTYTVILSGVTFRNDVEEVRYADGNGYALPYRYLMVPRAVYIPQQLVLDELRPIFSA